MKVLVTGGSKGIGQATVQLYKEQGYDVFAPTRAELDLSSRESVLAFVERYQAAEFGIIVNNAGCNYINAIDNIVEEELDEMISVNLLSPMLLLRGFVPGMKLRKFGRIVNISSIWSVVSKPGRVVYSATKNGIHGITATLASELAPYNILVNTICPGFTMTELTKRTNTPEQIRLMATQVPLGRLAEPKEIAKAVFFAGNEMNTYMTGQKIVVDGGFTSI